MATSSNNRSGKDVTNFVGPTTAGGQSFQPVPLSAVEGSSTFFTQTDLLHHSPHGTSAAVGGGGGGSAFSHLRPMSPFERAGIPIQRSSTPAHVSSSGGGSHLPPRPSSSLAVNLPVLSRTEDAKYESSLAWFQSHYFYASGNQSKSAAGKARGSITSGSFSAGSGSGFFNAVIGTRKIASYVGPYAQPMQELRQAFDTNACPVCLSSICSNLLYRVDERGLITFGDAINFLADLVPPPASAAFAETSRQFLLQAGGSSIQPLETVGSPKSPYTPSDAVSDKQLAWAIPFPTLFRTLEAMFVGSLSPLILQKCFDLCDVTHCGYILKDIFRQFRDEERMAALAGSPPAAGSAGTILPPKGLSYLVVKGAWRVFEKIAIAEEEKVRNTVGKGKKAKSKKGATGPVTVPGKRQFHISFAEFSSAMKEDAHMVLAFLPHAIETALSEKLVPIAAQVQQNVSPPSSPIAATTSEL